MRKLFKNHITQGLTGSIRTKPGASPFDIDKNIWNRYEQEPFNLAFIYQRYNKIEGQDYVLGKIINDIRRI
ncbi:hypothetical protein COR50_17330 [Chitinophaga caeni]|uniref:Uncharacterized protein n=1 Tax=Chitinophaga caeni TaxID=2029983 RepID=A0A291QY42_9BACT|nr:hypothetical protein COR50_17330 [Chitinophaga caeni]